MMKRSAVKKNACFNPGEQILDMTKNRMHVSRKTEEEEGSRH